MKHQRLRYFIFLFLFVIVKQHTFASLSEKDSLYKAKGGKYYGGIFDINEPDFIKTLFPHYITDAISYRVANNIYEGLMKYDQKDLSLKNALAESYTIDPSLKVYTFKLRKGILFHDNKCFANGKGRELTTKDVEFCFTLLCRPGINNMGFSCFDPILKGAHNYYEEAKKGTPTFQIEGIKIIDRYTIQLILNEPNPLFLHQLARPFTYLFPQEAYEYYNTNLRINAVGTGPFTLSFVSEGGMIILKKNPHYYLTDEYGNTLPYLDALRIHFLKDKKMELLELRNRGLDMMYRVPTDYLIEIVESYDNEKGKYREYQLQRNPEFSTHFLGFNINDTLFKNINLRKAISHAIDRKKILDALLNGEGYAHGMYGFTPLDAFPDYDVTNISGDELNIELAQSYLKKAGYANGTKVSKIVMTINADGGRNIEVAEELKKQLENNLEIEIEINVVTTAQLTTLSTTGKTAFFLAGWQADYPDPENFLWFFYGKNMPAPDQQSYPNLTRYVNKKYDALYEAGLEAKTKKEKYDCFTKAEQLVMEDAPVIVLWYEEGYRLVQSNVNGFDNNAMQYRDFTKVFFTPLKK